MGVLTRLSTATVLATRPADDDYWYEPIGLSSLTGIRVTPETAFKCSAVYAGVKVISETFGALPAIIYERLPDGGKDRAPSHPLHDILRYEPNGSQTAFEFWRLMIAVAILYGASYAEIKSGARGAVDSLVPLPPSVTHMVTRNGEQMVETRDETGFRRFLFPDEVFTLPGLSLDGVSELGIPDVAKDAIGLAIATEQWGARFFSQSSTPGGILSHPGKLGEEAAKRLGQSWQAARSGLNSAHKVAVLEEGMTYVKTTTDAEQAQMIETRKHQLEEVARYLHLPPHKIGIMEHATFSNIEEQALEFVTDTIQPLVTMVEQRIRKQLLIAKNRFTVEFLLDNLLRGRMKERAETYAIYHTNGIMSTNEIRMRENLNPVEGGDTPIRAGNIGNAPAPVAAKTDRGEQIALKFAERLVRREVAAISAAAKKSASDHTAFSEWLTDFYGKQADILMADMHMSGEDAQGWCAGQKAEVQNFGVSVIESWADEKPDKLAQIALRG